MGLNYNLLKTLNKLYSPATLSVLASYLLWADDCYKKACKLIVSRKKLQWLYDMISQPQNFQMLDPWMLAIAQKFELHIRSIP